MTLFLIIGVVFFVRCAIAQDFTMDCDEHCQVCKDEVAEDCVNNTVLLLDGDVCKCCDQCGFRRAFQQDCTDHLVLNKDEGKVDAKVVPVKCLHGYECVSGVCANSDVGFCSTYLVGRPYIYSCDNNGNFLPIECSKYHCWCINPITGNPITKTKVPKPMDSGNVSYCYYLMTINGLLDFLVPGSRPNSAVYLRSNNGNENQDFTQIFPANVLHGIDVGLTKRRIGSKNDEDCRGPNCSHVKSRRKGELVKDSEDESTTKMDYQLQGSDVFYKLRYGNDEMPGSDLQKNIPAKQTATKIKMRGFGDGPKPLHLMALTHIKNLAIDKAKAIMKNLTSIYNVFENNSEIALKLRHGKKGLGNAGKKWTHLIFQLINYLERNLPENATDIYFGKTKYMHKRGNATARRTKSNSLLVISNANSSAEKLNWTYDRGIKIVIDSTQSTLQIRDKNATSNKGKHVRDLKYYNGEIPNSGLKWSYAHQNNSNGLESSQHNAISKETLLKSIDRGMEPVTDTATEAGNVSFKWLQVPKPYRNYKSYPKTVNDTFAEDKNNQESSDLTMMPQENIENHKMNNGGRNVNWRYGAKHYSTINDNIEHGIYSDDNRNNRNSKSPSIVDQLVETQIQPDSPDSAKSAVDWLYGPLNSYRVIMQAMANMSEDTDVLKNVQDETNTPDKYLKVKSQESESNSRQKEIDSDPEHVMYSKVLGHGMHHVPMTLDDIPMDSEHMMRDKSLNYDLNVRDNAMNIEHNIVDNSMDMESNIRDNMEHNMRNMNLKNKIRDNSINMENNMREKSINMEHNIRDNSMNMENNIRDSSMNMENNMNMEHNIRDSSLIMENNLRDKSLNMENNMRDNTINMEHNMSDNSMNMDHKSLNMDLNSLNKEHSSMNMDHNKRDNSINMEHYIRENPMSREHDNSMNLEHNVHMEHNIRDNSMHLEHDSLNMGHNKRDKQLDMEPMDMKKEHHTRERTRILENDIHENSRNIPHNLPGLNDNYILNNAFQVNHNYIQNRISNKNKTMNMFDGEAPFPLRNINNGMKEFPAEYSNYQGRSILQRQMGVKQLQSDYNNYQQPNNPKTQFDYVRTENEPNRNINHGIYRDMSSKTGNRNGNSKLEGRRLRHGMNYGLN